MQESNFNDSHVNVPGQSSTAPQNAHPNRTSVPENSFSKVRTGLKMLLIAGICLTFFIPQLMIMHLVDERQLTKQTAQDELSKSWGGEQHVSGPVLIIPGYESSTPGLVICPSDLNINAEANTETLKRGIFHFNAYQTTVQMSGKFNCPDKIKQRDLSGYDLGNAFLLLDISDLRGLTDNVRIKWGDKTLATESASASNNSRVCGLMVATDFHQLMDSDDIAFQISIPLKGTNSIYFTPVGNTNKISLHSDYGSPSFQGNFLPTTRSISDTGFTAQWSVLALNRTFGQVTTLNESWSSKSSEAELGVEFCIPVDQYQQTTRSVKYSVLIVLLTFAVVFFIEIKKRTRIHPIQYVLIGIAIVLFYTLLLSLSEHIAFLLAYIIAAIVTIGCITLYLSAIIKNVKTALAIGSGLTLLYTLIFVLLQLEDYALLVGSIGLFCILGAAMYASQKITWYGEK